MIVPSALERVRRHFNDPRNWPIYSQRSKAALLREIAEVVEWFDQLTPRHCVPKSALVLRFEGVPDGVSRIAPDDYQCALSGLHKDVWPLLNPEG